MKRQVKCEQCAKEYGLKRYNDEWAVRISGTAKFALVCDLCGRIILEGSTCYAESFGTQRQLYFQWETNVIIPDGTDERT